MFLYSFKKRIRNRYFGASLIVQWLRLPLFNAGDAGSIPDWEAKILHTLGPKNRNIKQNQYCNKFNKDTKAFIMVPFKKNLKKNYFTLLYMLFFCVCIFFTHSPLKGPSHISAVLSSWPVASIMLWSLSFMGAYLIHSSISSNLTLTEVYPRRMEDMETEFSAHNCLEWWL